MSEILARKAVLARLGASTTLNNSNNTRILQHLNTVSVTVDLALNAMVTLDGEANVKQL